MERGQDAYMEIRKELYNNIQAQSEFYLNQGFFHNLEHMAAQIWKEKYARCFQLNQQLKTQTGLRGITF